jgi:hypothetical protein
MLALVLNSNSYNFLDKDGKKVNGSTVEMIVKSEGRLKTSKISSGDVSYMTKLFPVYPGIYEIKFDTLPLGGNRFKTVISDASLIQEFPIDLDI